MSLSRSSSFHRVRDGTRSSSKGKAASPSTSAAGRPCAGAGVAASTRHSVAYRWRCAGASGRSARDLKPSSCALDCPSTPPRLRWRRPPRHLAEPLPPTARRVAPRSRASSTANGRSVSPPAPLEASAPLVQSASSRSAEWTCVPSRAERVRSRTGAPRVHQRAVLQPDRVEPVIERPTSAATKGSRKDAYSNPKQSHRKSNPV